MAQLITVLETIGVVLCLAVVYCLLLVLRRRALARKGGTFELSYRARPQRSGRGWLLGIGRYDGETLEWFRIFSLAPGAKRSWQRRDVEFRGRRSPQGAETEALYADHVIVTCMTPDGSLELAMSTESLMGFQAWLEAMPPGSRGVRPGDEPAVI